VGDILITSPKRDRSAQAGWEGFFPYYAGYPTRFASEIIRTAGLSPRSSVLDPWNGSGTTTYAAAQLGHTAIGFDLNPVMIVIGRARMLAASEADSLVPLCKEILRGARVRNCENDEPLLGWFGSKTAGHLRSIERSIRRCLVGTKSQSNLDHLSAIAATFYSALFSVCRDLTSDFQSSNPTWVRIPRDGGERVVAEPNFVATQFKEKLEAMSKALAVEAFSGVPDVTVAACRLGDSTKLPLQASSIDLILGSPPYCTRIDYSAATRVELAVLSPLTSVDQLALSRQMIGSTRVPRQSPRVEETWGDTCLSFLASVKQHPSKASAGYYYKSHADYFDKMFSAFTSLSTVMRPSAKAVIVVQDSYYKELHNDLARIFSEMATNAGLKLTQRADFDAKRSMGSVNRGTRAYRTNYCPVESVLCFEKRS
jgi:SAM-dependent methyltransferase